ncbi:glycosyltransferase family 4 protein, partial [Vibrio cyclitrophicus]
RNNPEHGVFVSNIKKELENHGLSIDVAKCGETKFKLINYFMFFVNSFLLMSTKRYELIYCHFSSHTFFVHFLKKILFLKTNVITHLHGSDAVTSKNSIKYRINKYTLDRSELIIFPSEGYRDYIVNLYVLNNIDKLFVFPSGGVKDEFFDKGNISEKVKTFGYIGRLVKEKGIYTLLDSFSKYQAKHIDSKLIICGYGPEVDNIINYISENSLLNINLIPQVSYDSLPEYFNEIDCLIFPTEYKYESLGLVGLEALSLKTFLIASNSLGPTSYIHGSYALTFELGNSCDLLEKMEVVNKLSIEERTLCLSRAHRYALEYKTSTVVKKLHQKVIELCS